MNIDKFKELEKKIIKFLELKKLIYSADSTYFHEILNCKNIIPFMCYDLKKEWTYILDETAKIFIYIDKNKPNMFFVQCLKFNFMIDSFVNEKYLLSFINDFKLNIDVITKLKLVKYFKEFKKYEY